MRLTILFISFLVLIQSSLMAQEEIIDLWANPLLHEGPSSARAAADTLNLPFLEDFNEADLYPDPDLWMDAYVFVNRNMSVDPPTIGTATFDGLNEYGLPYDILTPNAWGPADALTSNPINLNFDPADSVFISFWYQAEGLGNAPELEDSLILEFFSPVTGWQRAWSAVGQGMSEFRQVILPITDTMMLRRGFQFRFRNYASLGGNLDHWHVDYIYLDDQRSATDSLIDDIGVVQDMLPLTEYYSAMPWKHFLSLSSPGDWIVDQQYLHFRNFSSGTRNVNFGHELYQDGSLNFASPVFFKNSAPNSPDSVNNLYDFSGVTNNQKDSSDILIKYFIKTLPDVEPENDTIYYHQNFHNYYAFDDGTAERGYSLNAIQAKMAVKYYPILGDSLRGIQIFFPPVLVEAPLNSFKIGVWSYDNGLPGNPIWKSDSLYDPVYSVWNEMVRYTIPAIYLSDTVFIGIEQLTASRLYVGFDRNLKNEDKIFYNLDGNWYGSTIEGSLMIRPMFGGEVQSNVSVEEIPPMDLTLYPNPSDGWIHLKGDFIELDYQIFDMSGRSLMSGRMESRTLDVQHLSSGMYIVRFRDGIRQKTMQFLIR